ncbi:MAG TPA: type II toxin-antitoxin system RelE/ParE family toxin [Thermoanaerobaculia bacterium]|nr:type II toxin-antitoxin system RelE/ParE family toxin [Thermoanaerobaculia bacterium]
MILPVTVRPLAERDLREAQLWYEEKRPGLGAEFRSCIDECLRTIARSPLLFPVTHRNVRRAGVKRFPYLVYFVLQPERVLIIACFHTRRDPRLVLRRVPH